MVVVFFAFGNQKWPPQNPPFHSLWWFPLHIQTSKVFVWKKSCLAGEVKFPVSRHSSSLRLLCLKLLYPKHIQLIGGYWWYTYPFENSSQLGLLFPTYGTTCFKPPTSTVSVASSSCSPWIKRANVGNVHHLLPGCFKTYPGIMIPTFSPDLRIQADSFGDIYPIYTIPRYCG